MKNKKRFLFESAVNEQEDNVLVEENVDEGEVGGR